MNVISMCVRLCKICCGSVISFKSPMYTLNCHMVYNKWLRMIEHEINKYHYLNGRVDASWLCVVLAPLSQQQENEETYCFYHQPLTKRHY